MLSAASRRAKKRDLDELMRNQIANDMALIFSDIYERNGYSGEDDWDCDLSLPGNDLIPTSEHRFSPSQEESVRPTEGSVIGNRTGLNDLRGYQTIYQPMESPICLEQRIFVADMFTAAPSATSGTVRSRSISLQPQSRQRKVSLPTSQQRYTTLAQQQWQQQQLTASSWPISRRRREGSYQQGDI